MRSIPGWGCLPRELPAPKTGRHVHAVVAWIARRPIARTIINRVTDPRLDASLTLWEQHARHDPLWAILSDPSFRDRKWNATQFFETGAREISLLILDRKS